MDQAVDRYFTYRNAVKDVVVLTGKQYSIMPSTTWHDLSNFEQDIILNEYAKRYNAAVAEQEQQREKVKKERMFGVTGNDDLPITKENHYPHDRYAALVNKTVYMIKQLGKLKGGEYAGDNDRLANFRRNGEAIGLPMETIWRVYAGKHWDAISQFVHDLQSGKSRGRMEPIEGRVDDLIVYLILFKAMLDERGMIDWSIPENPNQDEG